MTVRLAVDVFPSRSVAVMSMVFIPGIRLSAVLKFVPVKAAFAAELPLLLAVTVALGSSTLPVISMELLLVTLLSAGAEIVKPGAVRSRVIVREFMAWLLAWSVAIVVMVLAPSTRVTAMLKEPSGATVTAWPLTVKLFTPLPLSLTVPATFSVTFAVVELLASVERLRVGAVMSLITSVPMAVP